MVDEPSGAALCQKTIVADFLSTINSKNGLLTEIAFAEAGGMKFTRAVYLEVLEDSDLKKFCETKANVSFVSGICPNAIQPAVLNTLDIRKSSDKSIRIKNIFSFDVDFKHNVSNYTSHMRASLLPKLYRQLISCFYGKLFRPWLIVFSGNGFQVHFRLKTPYELQSTSEFTRIHTVIREHLESISGLVFDKACSNAGRLMRLPYSTNRKDANDPIPTSVYWHDPDADFSKALKSFASNSLDRAMERHVVDKQKILNSLDLIKVLNHFGYTKHSSITEKSNQIICSSPFTVDSNPSFSYEKTRKIFYDFSAGFGGDLFTLIGRLASIDSRVDFYQVLQLAAKIADVNFERKSNSPNLSQRPKQGFDLVSMGDLLSEPEEQIEWLVDDLLPMGGTSLVCGKPKVGKTTLVRLLALNVATGERFLDRSVTKGKVIYLALEEKRSQVRIHFQEMGARGDEEIFIHASAAPLEHLRATQAHCNPI